MFIRMKDVNPVREGSAVVMDCPLCMRNGHEPHRVTMPGADAAADDMDTLTVGGVVQAGHWTGVITNGIVGTIVPMQGHATATGSMELGRKV